MPALRSSKPYPLSLPYEGMDLSTPLPSLPPTRAPWIENLFLDGQTIRVRGGTRISSTYTGSGGTAVFTGGIGTYTSTTGAKTLYATSEEGATRRLVNVSSSSGSSVATSAPYYSLFAQFRNAFYVFDEINSVTPLYYDGSSWTAFAFTGVTASNLCYGAGYRNRFYMVERDSTRVWYGGVNSISGALSSIDFSGVLESGGYVHSVHAVSFGGNSPAKQYLAVVSSEGEILFYGGTYPGDPSFSIVTRAKVAKPWGRRSKTVFQGDVYLCTDAGLVSLRGVLSAAFNNQTYIAVSDPISPYWRGTSERFRTNDPASNKVLFYYFSCEYCTANSCIYISFPFFFPRIDNQVNWEQTSSDAMFLVYNTLTGAWWQYTYSSASMRQFGVTEFGQDMVCVNSQVISAIDKQGVYNDEDPFNAGTYDDIESNILSSAFINANAGITIKQNNLVLHTYLNYQDAVTPVSTYLVENFGKVTGTTTPAVNADESFNKVGLNVGSTADFVQFSLTLKTNASDGLPTTLYAINSLSEGGGFSG